MMKRFFAIFVVLSGLFSVSLSGGRLAGKPVVREAQARERAAVTREAQARQRAAVTIEVPSKSNLQFFTLWVALGSGFFQEEGLEPQLIVDEVPRNAGQYLLDGKADVALLQPPMFLGRMAEERPIVLFASLLANEPINLVVRKDIADARKVPLGASLRERLQAIKGLRIGVAG